MIMTYQEANSISIKDYLESLGILPVVDKLYYGMYHSPFRQDNTPSFKAVSYTHLTLPTTPYV